MEKTAAPRLLVVLALITAYVIWRSMPVGLTNVTFRGIVISLPNADATQFSSQHNLAGQPADALKSLESLVSTKKATSIANPTVTTKSGQRAVSDSGEAAILEVEPMIAKDRRTAEVRVAIVEQEHRIVSSIQVEKGGTRFLGTVQNPTDATRTDYIFVRVSF